MSYDKLLTVIGIKKIGEKDFFACYFAFYPPPFLLISVYLFIS